MVEPIAAAAPLPLPAELADAVAVQGAKGVAKAARLETLQQGQLGAVVALPPLLS